MANTTAADELRHVPLSQLKPAEDNIRRDLGDLTELAASIKELGLLEPIIATPNGGGTDGPFVIVAGHRRHAAAKLAKVRTVPVIVRDYDEIQRVIVMLVENLQRADIDPLEEGAAYQKLGDLGLKQRDIATRVARSQSHISKRLGIVKLPETAQAALAAGNLTVHQAEQLGRIRDPKDLEKLCKKINPGRPVNGWEIDGALRRQERHDLEAKAEKDAAASGLERIDQKERWRRTDDEYRQDLWASCAKEDASAVWVNGSAAIWVRKRTDEELGGERESWEAEEDGADDTPAPTGDEAVDAERVAAHKAAIAERERQRVVWTEITDRRREFLTRFLTQSTWTSTQQKRVEQYLLDYLLELATLEDGWYLEFDCTNACRLLTVDDNHDASRALRFLAGEGAPHRDRALLALAFTEDEAFVRGALGSAHETMDDRERTITLRHYAFIQELGYEPGPPEEHAALEELARDIFDAPSIDVTLGADPSERAGALNFDAGDCCYHCGTTATCVWFATDIHPGYPFCDACNCPCEARGIDHGAHTDRFTSTPFEASLPVVVVSSVPA